MFVLRLPPLSGHRKKGNKKAERAKKEESTAAKKALFLEISFVSSFPFKAPFPHVVLRGPPGRGGLLLLLLLRGRVPPPRAHLPRHLPERVSRHQGGRAGDAAGAHAGGERRRLRAGGPGQLFLKLSLLLGDPRACSLSSSPNMSPAPLRSSPARPWPTWGTRWRRWTSLSTRWDILS